MFTNSNRVSPVPLIPAEVIEMDPANPPAGGPPPVGFEDVEMNDPQAPEVPVYAPQQEFPAIGMPVGFEGVDQPRQPAANLYPDTRPGYDVPTPVDPGSGTTPSSVPLGFDGTGAEELPETNTDQNEMNGPQDSRTELEEKRETMFFRDGKRRIDFVLALTEKEDKPSGKEAEKESKKKEKRDVFEENLRKEGLELEYEDKRDGKTHFVKIHAPWEVLTRVAELLNLKMPIKEYDIEDSEEGCLSKIPNPFEIGEDLIKDEPDYFTADFSRERQEMFIIKDKETFFTNAQRSLLVNELLLRTRYEGERDKFGIDRLLRHGVYSAAYPLHEGKYTSPHSILVHGAANDRHLLYETWARPGRWYFNQPLDLIRKYFGEKIGIYFAWLGFYTYMLLPAAIVGFIVFIYGCATLFDNIPSNDICNLNNAGNFTMCPLCDGRCSYWRLRTSCLYSRFTYLFDNGATVFFAAFMAVWSTMFLEFWKRKQATIQYDWDVAGFELEERLRPDYEAKVKSRRKNPITQMMEPFVPIYSKIPRRLTSVVVVLFMIACVVAAVFGVIMYRIIVVTVFYASPEELIRRNAKITTTVTAAIINLIAIMLLNRVYTVIAVWLTNLERPRTDTEYEDSFTFKMFLFQFINYYSSIFYIAFFKGSFAGAPGDYNYRLGNRLEECDPAGCLTELCIQLAIVMVGKQTWNNFQEIMLPKILNWIRQRAAKKAEKKAVEENLYTRWEQDKDLQAYPDMGLFTEYLEMVIQYGFVTIFVAAFPLAPMFALMNNVIEIRLDAYKYVTQFRRPVAVKAQDIGIWYSILKGITFIAVLSNAFIIGWTSDFVPKLVYVNTDSEDGTLTGYVNHSLSFFDVNDFQNRSRPDNPKVDEFGVVHVCRYRDYREPPWESDKYKFTAMYWHIFMARLAFIICFEHAVFFVTYLVGYLIPDVPSRVKQLMLREMYLAKEARYHAAFSTLAEDQRNRKESEAKLA